MNAPSSTTYELLSTDLYYIKAENLSFQIQSKIEDGLNYTSVAIVPNHLESVILNNNRLSVRGRFYGGREFIEKRKCLNDTEIENLLSEFRGTIIGYPYYQLKVVLPDEMETINCDAIRIKGGYKNKFPFIGYSTFSLVFISFSRNGNIEKVKSYDANDVGKLFTITKIPKEGQIISKNDTYSPYLNPSDLEDFIDGVRTSYMGQPPCEWKEVRGTVLTDSLITHLKVDINLESKILKLSFSENLHERTYEIISHSSMDPGNDECVESTDRYIWAVIAFTEKSLIELIKVLSRSALVSMLDNNFICFNSPLKKSEFEKLTGIHLVESIIETSTRY